MIIGQYNFNENDRVYHVRLKKEGVFREQLDNDYGIVEIEGKLRKVNLALLEEIE